MKICSPRQLAFVAAYLRHGVAERAAIEAGYSRHTARGSAHRLLANAGIQSAIASLATVAQASTVADLKEIRQRWTAVMRGETGAGMSERLRASELLAKSYGAFLPKPVLVEPAPVPSVVIERRTVHFALPVAGANLESATITTAPS